MLRCGNRGNRLRDRSGLRCRRHSWPGGGGWLHGSRLRRGLRQRLARRYRSGCQLRGPAARTTRPEQLALRHGSRSNLLRAWRGFGDRARGFTGTRMDGAALVAVDVRGCGVLDHLDGGQLARLLVVLDARED